MRGWAAAGSIASASVACVRTWTAPQAGTIEIIGRIMKEYYHRDQGGPLRARILKGTRQLWPEQDWATAPVHDLTGVAHDLKTDVAAGDAIRFVLDRGTSPEHDILAWMPRIVYLDGQPGATKAAVVRILCGATEPYIDRTGNVWSADRFHTGGEPFSTREKIAGATPTPEDEPLYQAGRTGAEFSYAIPVPPGLYSLRLKFAEPQYPWIFERPFNLDINGRRVLRNFDICQAARGPRRAYERVFHYLVPNADGQLVLRFTGGWEPMQKSKQALVQAIEVLPELRPAIRIDAGSESQFIDWNSFVWASDARFEGGEILSVGRASHSDIADPLRSAALPHGPRWQGLPLPVGRPAGALYRPPQIRRTVAQRAGTPAHGHRSERPARLEGVGSWRGRRAVANGRRRAD